MLRQLQDTATANQADDHIENGRSLHDHAIETVVYSIYTTVIHSNECKQCIVE